MGGASVREMLPFGARMFVKQRSWKAQAHEPKAVEATLLAPARDVAGSWPVRTVDNEYLATSVLHRDVLACPEPNVIRERDQAPDAAPVLPAPSHRVTGKSKCAEIALEPSSSLPVQSTIALCQETFSPRSEVGSTEARPAESTHNLSPSSARSDQPVAPHPGIRTACLEDVLQAEDHQASMIAQDPMFDLRRARSFLCKSHWGSKAAAAQLKGSKARSAMHCVLGMYRHGGVLGVTQASGRFPGFLALLVRMIEAVAPAFAYTSLAVVSSTCIPPHKDTSNRPSSNLMLPLKLPKRGLTIWTEATVGDVIQGPLEQLEVTPSQTKVGHTTLLKLLEPLFLDARRWHATYTKDEGQSLLLSAYSLSAINKAPQALTNHLTALGLPLPTADSQQGGGLCGFGLGGGDEIKKENLRVLVELVEGDGVEERAVRAVAWEGALRAKNQPQVGRYCLQTPPGQGPCGFSSCVTKRSPVIAWIESASRVRVLTLGGAPFLV